MFKRKILCDASGYARFDIAPNGRAERLILESFDENGIGVFERRLQ
ncbi:hypothetical protein ACFL7E_00600 [Thermodesulfobacteriota bacterium]